MRKPRFLFLVLLAGVVTLHAQTTIHLTFTAYADGFHKPLDSINVRNLTQGGDTTLKGNDTVLSLSYGTGWDEWARDPSGRWILYPVTPNPVTHTATLRLYLPEEETMTLKVSDLSGWELVAHRQSLQPGIHTFTFTPGRESMYFISVRTAGWQQVQKLLSPQGSATRATLVYDGFQSAARQMKKEKAVFHWTPGDHLMYTGYSGYEVDAMDDLPSQSTLYTFSFDAVVCPPTLTDINGNVYNAVQIGSQCWMRENLRVRNYRNGTAIPEITNNASWKGLTTGARCWYNVDSATYAAIYGAMYNWYACVDTNGLCPAGWHVPTDLEWKALEIAVGMSPAVANNSGYRGNDEGGKLKDTTTVYWEPPNTGATNSSGYTGLPGGYRLGSDGTFASEGQIGYWWTSTAFSTSSAWYHALVYNYPGVARISYGIKTGFSVRCLKDH